jgi:hypothetical protein
MITVSFEMYLITSTDMKRYISVTVTETFFRYAEKDEWGRPTECNTDAEISVDEILYNGRDITMLTIKNPIFLSQITEHYISVVKKTKQI